ncbi:hypothetical protein [Roseococcus sp.]|uniref:hypothetical protein n=1 Tax=Roseococcus sp. TaxID=2109646 RepID=UPI003BA94F80
MADLIDAGWEALGLQHQTGEIMLLCHKDDPEVVFSGWYEAAPADRRWYSCLNQEPCNVTHVATMVTPLTPSESVIKRLGKMHITSALWWFIENMPDNSPHRNDAFFHLRERVRALKL